MFAQDLGQSQIENSNDYIDFIGKDRATCQVAAEGEA
jgi:hypothetical protein